MKKLSLNDIIEIYLGNSLFQGMEINASKELALQEIKRRTIEYRNINKIPELVSKLNVSLSQSSIIGKTNAVTFVDNLYYVHEIVQIAKKLEAFCLNYFRPNLSLLSESYDIINKLDEIWEYDPEHIRHSSKFNDRRALSQSQEYYDYPNLGNFLFTRTKIWRYEISATLGNDYMRNIIDKAIKTDITFLPISSKRGYYNRALILKFILNFYALKSRNSYLWILFVSADQDLIDVVKEDIMLFLRKLPNKPFFFCDLLPYTIIKQTDSGDLDVSVLLKDLDEFANKYIA